VLDERDRLIPTILQDVTPSENERPNADSLREGGARDSHQLGSKIRQAASAVLTGNFKECDVITPPKEDEYI
jgi:hypothetical protein